MTGETLEMRRLVGKFALLLAIAYVLILFGGVMALAQGTDFPVVTYPLVVLPAVAFVPAVIDAVRLHRTADAVRTKALWRRSALSSLIGVALLIAIAVMVNQVNG